MPDFVDKTFDACYAVYQAAASTMQNAYDHTKDVSQDAMDYAMDELNTLRNSSKNVIETIEPPPAPEPQTKLEQVEDFLLTHKTQIGIYGGIPLTLYTGYKIFRVIFPYQRRVQKLKNGSRYEVILVVGHPQSNFLRQMVSDLSGRGYIVFVAVANERQLKLIEQEQDEDIRPLIVDCQSASTVKSSLLKLARFLDKPSKGIKYHLRGCIFVPDYLKMPRISRIGQLSGREFKRVLDEQFIKANLMIANGLKTFLGQSNKRKQLVGNYDKVSIGGGYSKLMFINFTVSEQNENRTLFVQMAQYFNRALYETIYRETTPSFGDSILRYFGFNPDPMKVDMTMLTIKYQKNKDSHLLGDFPIMQSSHINRKLSYRDVHYKVFDLLNSRWLKKDYDISN